MNIILMGPPGSGKGTQSAMLEKHLGIPSISTGEILRNEVANGSEIGKIAKHSMDNGGLVSDNIILQIIDKVISSDKCHNGFILDGFPRNLDQGKALDTMLNNIGKDINLVINIKVPDNIIIKRISGRFTCSKCSSVYNKFFHNVKNDNVCDVCNSSNSFVSRSDDNKTTIKHRLQVYYDTTMDLISFYEKKDLIYSIDGLKDISLVGYDISEIIGNFSKK